MKPSAINNCGRAIYININLLVIRKSPEISAGQVPETRRFTWRTHPPPLLMGREGEMFELSILVFRDRSIVPVCGKVLFKPISKIT